MNRRAFLGTLAGAAIAPKVFQVTAHATPAPEISTLTGRILKTLAHRKQLGLTNHMIVVSPAGLETIAIEHGYAPDPRDCWTLRGVPVCADDDLSADSYGVLG